MGLFTQRPEQNEEWAGLPSEPARPGTPAEQLGGSPPPDLGAVHSLGGTSISIPIPTPLESEGQPADDGEASED